MNEGYLAGLIEGEGCFGLYLKKGYYQPRFSMCLRDDDEQILRDLLDTLNIKKKLIRVKQRGNHKPQVEIILEHPDDNLKLINFLVYNPFIGKKRPQYEVWKEAVLFHRRNRNTTRGNPEKRKWMTLRFESYFTELKQLKEYPGGD